MNKTKIEWADCTWNPVTGCLHGCKYCYARRIAERFGMKFAPRLGDPGMEGACKYDSEEAGQNTMLELEKPYRDDNGVLQPYPMAFLPTFHCYKLDEPARKTKGVTIFVGSMTDLFGKWVPDEWIEAVFEACRRAPQHRYLFLTKNPQRYNDLMAARILPEGDNYWYGGTRTGLDSTREHEAAMTGNTFLSVEPIHAPMERGTLDALELWGWVILGAETGNRKDKVVPRKEWVEEIANSCTERGVPVFMKDSLVDIVGEENMRRDFPWGGRR